MSKVKEIKGSGRLVLSEIPFKNCFYTRVGPCNERCSRIYLPRHLEGKHVYVVVDPDDHEGG